LLLCPYVFVCVARFLMITADYSNSSSNTKCPRLVQIASRLLV
jgi:hypothetical protein